MTSQEDGGAATTSPSPADADAAKTKKKQEARQDFLNSVLEDPTTCCGVTPQSILDLSDDDLLNYALLILALLGRCCTSSNAQQQQQQQTQVVFEGSSSSAAEEETPQSHSHHSQLLVDAFLSRVQKNRVLKLRVALLLGLGKMKSQWNVQLKYSTTKADTTKTEKKEGQPATAAASSITAQDLLLDKLGYQDALRDYVTQRFFHPTFGIHLKDKKRALGLRTISKSFSKQYAILWIMQDLACNKDMALEIFDKMESEKLIKLVVKSTKLGEGGTGGITGRISGTVGTFAGLGNALYQPTSAASSNTPCTADEEISDLTGSFTHVSTTNATETTSLWGGGGTNTTNLIVIPMDALDIQSLKFWRDTIWQSTTSLKEGYQFGSSTVVHPMSTTTSTTAAAAEGGKGDPDSLIHLITVIKVFDSMAKPAFLKLSSYREGSIIEDNTLTGTGGGNSDEASDDVLSSSQGLQEMNPRVIAKNGDNLLNDASVELLFRIFTHIWETDTSEFEQGKMTPFAYDYDVLPCGQRVGLLGCLNGLQPLNDFDWKSWTNQYRNNPKALAQMCCSAAGCSIATYVLGCGDRHWDNIQICDDGQTMLHIDFGMILGENPAFKTPRFSISAGQEKAFKDVGIWEQFLELCGKAFVSLRKRAPAILNVTSLVLEHAGRSQSRILKYLASKESFNIGQQDDALATELVLQQIRDSSTHWETIARKFTHDRIDPIFFKAVQAAPPALVNAVENIYNKT